MSIEVDDVVQIIDEEHKWFPCLVIVSELKEFGIQGYVIVPEQGNAYIRLNRDSYAKIGKAIVVAS